MQDKKSNRKSSRRKWFRQLAGPAAAITLGSSALDVAFGSTGGNETAHQAGSSADDKSLGARTYNVRDFGAKGDGVGIDTAACSLVRFRAVSWIVLLGKRGNDDPPKNTKEHEMSSEQTLPIFLGNIFEDALD